MNLKNYRVSNFSYIICRERNPIIQVWSHLRQKPSAKPFHGVLLELSELYCIQFKERDLIKCKSILLYNRVKFVNKHLNNTFRLLSLLKTCLTFSIQIRLRDHDLCFQMAFDSRSFRSKLSCTWITCSVSARPGVFSATGQIRLSPVSSVWPR